MQMAGRQVARSYDSVRSKTAMRKVLSLHGLKKLQQTKSVDSIYFKLKVKI